jgi:two-component system chemotaxis response regulator CheB
MRLTISKHLNAYPGISVVATARDGKEAMELIPKFKPDVLTLDVEMPRMDGLTTLREVMRLHPLPVVMVSSLTSEGTQETIQALTLGAIDFIAKPTFTANIASITDEIANKIIRASQAKVWQTSRIQTMKQESPPVGKIKRTRSMRSQDKIVVIGSSTGGPRALNSVIPKLPSNLNASYVVIQHMPAGFTRSLAERLDNASDLIVREAEPGDTIEVGRCLLAPGGFHMIFNDKGVVTLNQNPPVHGVRPAVDVTMLSLAQLFKDRTIGVILTGMGNDGTSAVSLVHSMGGWVIAEAEETSVVWGMPRSVVEAGVAHEVIPLDGVADAIIKAVES